jgi:uncharacterized protein YegL
MSNTPQKSLLETAIEFAENPEPRCPCVLLLDTSGSMEGAPIEALHKGLAAFKADLAGDKSACRRVEVAVITFDDTVNVVQKFVTPDIFELPTFTAGGHTCMAQGILDALDLVQKRKAQYVANGVAYYRPWIFMITDGEPDPARESEEVIRQASERLKAEETAKKVLFYAVGVENANLSRLAQISHRPPVKLNGLNFQDMFLWLSKSMESVVQGEVDEQLALPPPEWQLPLPPPESGA